MDDEPDTIAALATPAGVAMRAIVRTSGPRAVRIAESIRSASRSGFQDTDLQLGSFVVPAKVLMFHSPRSSTGEDVVEYHLPGSPWIVSRLLERLIELGARQAEPGEFTSRAFLNGKMDLAAAEGVVATISASNRAGLHAARQLLAGELSRRLRPIMDRLIDTLALVEVGIDFSEEEVSFIARDRLVAAIGAAREELTRLRDAAPSLERLEHEPRVVLAGRPNAGKSSLLNALAGKPRAVVADVAGTTRDVLTERIVLASGYVTLVDAAGLDDVAATTSIERQMRDASLRAVEQADQVVLVIAADDPRPALALPRQPDMIVRSKCDLDRSPSAPGEIPTTVKDPAGLAALRDALDAAVFASTVTDSVDGIALNARHRRAIDDAAAALHRALSGVDSGAEIIAAELRHAIESLGRVLGQVAPDDVLGRIFSGFCIGK